MACVEFHKRLIRYLIKERGQPETNYLVHSTFIL